MTHMREDVEAIQLFQKIQPPHKTEFTLTDMWRPFKPHPLSILPLTRTMFPLNHHARCCSRCGISPQTLA